jgi:glycogen(starch) synthase
MKIAYVSFEYPPDSAFGGISTYVHQASNMMSHRGHLVEVFCSSPERTTSETVGKVLVHRIKTISRADFPTLVTEVFAQRHNEVNFDILESPEYSGDGFFLKKQFPKLPLVVKLHTPSYLIHEINNYHISRLVKTRFLLGGLIRGKISKPFWKWKSQQNDIDYRIITIADGIHTPSISLGDIVSKKWGIRRTKIKDVPYPFIATNKFLDIPILSKGKTVTFIGRLEVRKGIIAFLRSVPIILQKVPDARIHFVGKLVPAVIMGKTLEQHLEEHLSSFQGRVFFTQVSQDQIPEVLMKSDVCVFPSIWENFPNVCLEAMSAGKAIVASKNGGMSDMLTSPLCGVLINPLNPRQIAEEVVALLNDSGKRSALGKSARESVLDKYNAEKIGSLMESAYTEIISRVKQKSITAR